MTALDIKVIHKIVTDPQAAAIARNFIRQYQESQQALCAVPPVTPNKP